MTAKKQSWADKMKDAIANVPTSRRKDKGKPYKGMLASFELKQYQTGSFGILFKYAVDVGEDKEPQFVYENVVLQKATANGMEPTKFGAKTLQRHLVAFGLSADEIRELGTPKTVRSEFNLSGAIGTPVTLMLVDAEYLGQPKLEVAAVHALDSEAA